MGEQRYKHRTDDMPTARSHLWEMNALSQGGQRCLNPLTYIWNDNLSVDRFYAKAERLTQLSEKIRRPVQDTREDKVIPFPAYLSNYTDITPEEVKKHADLVAETSQRILEEHPEQPLTELLEEFFDDAHAAVQSAEALHEAIDECRRARF